MGSVVGKLYLGLSLLGAGFFFLAKSQVAPSIDHSQQIQNPLPLQVKIDSDKIDGNRTDDQVASDWGMIAEMPEFVGSLVTYSRKDPKLWGFDPILDQNNYDSILKMCDLSYQVAKNHSIYSSSKSVSSNQQVVLNAKLDTIDRRANWIRDYLGSLGWNGYVHILGATGKDNVDADEAAVMSYNPREKLIILAFHGSRNGSKIPFSLVPLFGSWASGQGDWAANYDSEPVSGASLGIQFMPPEVQVHRGFGNNFSSTQESLFPQLEALIRRIPEGDRRQVWLIVTGHSKGGGVASIATPVIKRFLSASPELRDVKVGAVLFSVPRAFYGKASLAWVHSTMNFFDIIRVNVFGDPVPNAPFNDLRMITDGYKGIGTLILDSVEKVHERIQATYGKAVPGYLSIDRWAPYHYGSKARGEGASFDPEIVIRHHQLLEGLENANQHLDQKSTSIFTPEFFQNYEEYSRPTL